MPVFQILIINFIGGIFFVFGGWAAVFKKDWVWKFKEYAAKLEGIEVKRTREWEQFSTLAGTLAIIFGAFCIITGLVVLYIAWAY